jgi:hypothetical protein
MVLALRRKCIAHRCQQASGSISMIARRRPGWSSLTASWPPQPAPLEPRQMFLSACRALPVGQLHREHVPPPVPADPQRDEQRPWLSCGTRSSSLPTRVIRQRL